MNDNPLANALDATTPLGSWRIRRLFLIAITLFCMAVVLLIIWLGREGKIYENAMDASFYTLGFIFSVYVVGATWDDRNKYSGIVKGAIVEKADPDVLATTTRKMV